MSDDKEYVENEYEKEQTQKMKETKDFLTRAESAIEEQEDKLRVVLGVLQGKVKATKDLDTKDLLKDKIEDINELLETSNELGARIDEYKQSPLDLHYKAKGKEHTRQVELEKDIDEFKKEVEECLEFSQKKPDEQSNQGQSELTLHQFKGTLDATNKDNHNVESPKKPFTPH